jgi:hypothetical protein
MKQLTKQGSLTAFPFLVLRFSATLPPNNPLQTVLGAGVEAVEKP